MFEPEATRAADAMGELWGILCPDAGPNDYAALIERAREVVRENDRLRTELERYSPLSDAECVPGFRQTRDAQSSLPPLDYLTTGYID